MLILAAIVAGTSAQAAEPVAVVAANYVERIDSNGQATIRKIEPTAQLGRGERVVTVLKWNAQHGRHLATSRVPPALRLQSASRSDLLVSTDGGNHWLVLADYRQVPAGITHIRWSLDSGEGQLTYRAIVR